MELKYLFADPKLSQNLRSKGFDYPCFGYYSNTKTRLFIMTNVKSFYGAKNEDLAANKLAAPTYQQIADWFREKHNLEVYATASANGKFNGYIGSIPYNSKHLEKVTMKSVDYYQALIKAIEQALTLI